MDQHDAHQTFIADTHRLAELAELELTPTVLKELRALTERLPREVDALEKAPQ